MYPEPELLTGLRQFIGAMDDATWDGLFFISGFSLRVLPMPSPATRETVRLDDLQLWQIRARHHVRQIGTESKRRRLVSILNKSREKCNKNDGHPSHAICKECLDTPVLIDDVREGDICFPRLLGLPIELRFDGVHHGHEVADIRYEDALGDTGEQVKLGVHLKSRTRPRKQGLGRSVRQIKALYTQLFYSAYLALVGRIDFDVIGISVPNTIRPDTLDSMKYLVNELGFSFLVIDEDDWLRILDAVFERVVLESDSPS
jgi:hypothetical protein